MIRGLNHQYKKQDENRLSQDKKINAQNLQKYNFRGVGFGKAHLKNIIKQMKKKLMMRKMFLQDLVNV